tara:strand:- start:174 stop:1118 length:945 start_codon:yes stop_codon:yes gene_type:complete
MKSEREDIMTETDLVTRDNVGNYAAMSKLMGVDNSTDDSESKTSMLARVKIIHSPIMGMKKIDGEDTETVVVKAGSYCIQMPDDIFVYGSKLKIRPFMQRYMYKKYVQSTDMDTPGYFVKTVMADSLNSDLKDTNGGFNCGKPAGYIKDFKALSEDLQKVIKTIKRVRVIFGLATMENPIDQTGKKLSDIPSDIPVIFEIDNRTSFKTSGEPFNTLAKRKHLPIQHSIDFTTEAQEIATGAKYYTVLTKLDGKALDVSPEDAETLQSFLDWIANYNSYVLSSYDEKKGNNMSNEDIDMVDDFLGDAELPEIEVA